ncbi:peptidase C45 [Amycolatopsis sp. WAC 01376]|uniref:C45 family autoproteolytic acyltransferase/hydolase n=1 Tax=Amycolatopsis sp. WAC 01376 TaxID=2203195 RepID=UPI000F7ACA41|nr:C45 family peptidase [Amycolatopsis sp. WAC 01376]RSM56228.1 peptidase C45 [Amycolatopsis sp. WAC 01376]
MTRVPDVPFVRVEGDARTRGRAHGTARAAALRAFLDDDLCRLNRILWRPVSLATLGPTIDAYRTAIAAAVPELADEIDGLAEGAGLSRREAVLLQARREILGYRRVPAHGDCTAYARVGHGTPVLAQTVDLNGDLADQIAVLEVVRDGSPGRALVLSFGGQLGYLGLNDAGLAIGINLIVGGTWKPGVPPYLAVRYLLDHARDVKEGVELLQTLPLASSRNLVLCDRSRAAWVELVDGRLRTVSAPVFAHTNHILHPDLTAQDEVNRFARRSSVRRLEACVAGLAGLRANASAAEHFALLSVPPVHVAANGDIRHEHTVATVVLFPARGELHLRPGGQVDGPARVFTLR